MSNQSKTRTKLIGAVAQEDPVLRAVLAFVRVLGGEWRAIERDLSEAEDHAFWILARTGAVEGFVGTTYVPPNENEPVTNYEHLQGNFVNAPSRRCVVTDFRKQGIQTRIVRARLTEFGERCQRHLHREREYDPSTAPGRQAITRLRGELLEHLQELNDRHPRPGRVDSVFEIDPAPVAQGFEAPAVGVPSDLHPEGHDAGAANEDSHLSPAKLAELFDVPGNALRKRLERWRASNHAGWIENPDRPANHPQFLYRVGAVKHIIDALKATSAATSERPAHRKTRT